MFWRKPIEEGVTAGLRSAFAPGGSFTKALDEGLAPVWEEMRRLRRIERRFKWHPMEKAPEWLLDGRAVLVNQAGDFVWAASFEDGEGGRYWDADVEHGGQPLDPQPTHFFLVPDIVSPPERGAADGASSRHTGQLRDEPSFSNHNEESQTNGS